MKRCDGCCLWQREVVSEGREFGRCCAPVPQSMVIAFRVPNDWDSRPTVAGDTESDCPLWVRREATP